MRFAGYQPRDRVGEVSCIRRYSRCATCELVSERSASRQRRTAFSLQLVQWWLRLMLVRKSLAFLNTAELVSRLLLTMKTSSQLLCRSMVANIDEAREQGRKGRQWVESHVSPAAVAQSYLSLIADIGV
jgi:hypothetical protein